MDIETTPIPPDIEFVMDAALEHQELDATSHIALKLYAPRRALMDIIDSDWRLGPDTLQPRLAMARSLADMADSILWRLPVERRGAIALAGAQHVRHEVRSLAWTLATWAIEDEIVGGCLKPWKRLSHRARARYEMTPRQARRLHGPNWIRRYVKTNTDARQLRNYGGRTLRLMQGVVASDVRAAADALLADLVAQHDGYRRTNERAVRQMRGERAAPASNRLRRQRRQVIKRAAATAGAVLSPSDVSAFAAGRAVYLDGATLGLEVARVMSCATLGHSGLSVIAVDRASRRTLASLCVYHEATPALDQLTALALAMQSGEEAEILATANLSNVTDLGVEHPLIAERGRANRRPEWRPRDEQEMKNEAYWEQTKPLWVQSLGVFVLGRMWAAG